MRTIIGIIIGITLTGSVLAATQSFTTTSNIISVTGLSGKIIRFDDPFNVHVACYVYVGNGIACMPQ